MAPPSSFPNKTCIGRDINRNWPYRWTGDPTGASPDPCSILYKGESPGDSPENLGLRTLVDQLRDQNGIALYIDWHAYGQYLLSPLGFNCTLVPADVGKHIKLASLVSQVIRDYGGSNKTFTFGPSCSTLYPVTGSSLDYVYDVGKAEWGYTVELRDTGKFGFVLPPEQIRPAGEEMWAGIQAVLSLLEERYFDGEGPA